ncbi:hypothetical protein TL16_g05214 [Triparma laevis f. inornata]|uniref:2Fe-2S ferredoxin-type domain-containing protein n=1 Tax=Triparma laevis f. inornata TaxID=1714386 RepID=A0A9W7AHU1_9STRA|nr:hypothetical protein TL16_g05214 [Triparma laevis f. inornata]
MTMRLFLTIFAVLSVPTAPFHLSASTRINVITSTNSLVARVGQERALFGAIVSGGGSTSNDDSSQSRNYLGLLSNDSESALGTTNYPEDMIRVRFKNPPTSSGVGAGEDVVILAKPGANLLRLGDKNGVKVPRACRTGLCGTCTATLIDPTWPGGEELGGEPGRQTIRVCGAGAMLPEGCEEMVIDLYRNNVDGEDETPMSNPMARFDDGWETSYVADYQKDDRKEKGGVGDGGGKVVRDKPPAYDSGLGGVAPWDKVW